MPKSCPPSVRRQISQPLCSTPMPPARISDLARSPPRHQRRTDRRAAKAVWILELPGRSGTIHLMHHCPGFACSCHDLSTFGAVHKSFIAKLSAGGPTSNCFAVQHDSEYGAVYR